MDFEPTIIEEIRHSHLGASSADRWMNCTASPQIISGLDPSKIRGAGKAAAEGTVAHEIAAMCLKNDQDAWEYLNHSFSANGYDFEVDKEMADYVQVYLDKARSIIAEYPDAILKVEHSMQSVLDDDAFGTGDIVIEVPGIIIIIMDLKYGRGVVREPDDEQLRYYAYLAVENAEYTTSSDQVVEQWIIQPRIPHAKGVCRSWKTTVGETIRFFQEEILVAMRTTRTEHAVLKIGEWCRFCPARDACPALKEEVRNFEMLEPEACTSEEIGAILDKKKAILAYFKSMEQEAFKRAMDGDKVPGQKLVRKQANRIFRDQITEVDEDGEKTLVHLNGAIVEEFGDDAWEPPKLKGPAPIQKLKGGKKFVSRWAYTPDNGLTLAPESDKRIEVKRAMDEYLDRLDAGVKIDDL